MALGMAKVTLMTMTTEREFGKQVPQDQPGRLGADGLRRPPQIPASSG